MSARGTTARRAARGLPVLVALAAAAVTAGCTGAIVTDIRYDRGHAPPAEAVEGAVERASTKAAVLQRWGPPLEIFPQPDGDVWVYRQTVTDLDVINVNASILTGVVVPFYARVEGLQMDEVLWVFFGRDGRVRDVARRSGGPR